MQENIPLILSVDPGEEYALVDSGNGRKLERYGQYVIERPEAQAIWNPQLPPDNWAAADARFTGERDEEGIGRWQFRGAPLGETWPMAWDGMDYLGRFTSFRHVGVFPEQAAHWQFIDQAVREAGRPVKLLNLFAYTGIASLVAARAGAAVTHIDASKKAVGWARENQRHAGLENLPVRWICEDAMRFCEREVRRGNKYDCILLDPPKFGRGPKGETWQLFEQLPSILDLTRQLVSDNPLFVILTAYSIRASFFTMHEIMRQSMAGLGGSLESGELVIVEESASRRLSTSLFSRWCNA